MEDRYDIDVLSKFVKVASIEECMQQCHWKLNAHWQLKRVKATPQWQQWKQWFNDTPSVRILEHMSQVNLFRAKVERQLCQQVRALKLHCQSSESYGPTEQGPLCGFGRIVPWPALEGRPDSHVDLPRALGESKESS